ncbi:restriction endonuclease subunit S [Spirosoma utsteinense]|uniref:Restriction endonuclease S subunit n=1 Tax=Spirosoma utsteinense TaxID=2585773 RepID=A0ABR6WFE0_9BACT|nr:restriction endonuclease subunit S [Spirosoma utsteinense]MBC3789367.1 restriction endonuclease S subunit [Spirosoma utsteinense]MBC3795271.1 restriction endonuclease S subunit [Spirosoma utsteinense]
MELKKGYKQTEVGVIPEDWVDCKFEDVLTGFSSGQTPYRAIDRYYTGNIPWITSGELNYNTITDTIEKITKEAVVKTNLKIIPKGTFLFAITGLEAAGTRGSCAITGIEATTNQSCMALYPKKDLITTDYLFQFYVKYGDWLALQYCQGTKQQSYTGRIAKRLPIVLPPTIAEQTAIATALSDADALISRLETLIAKKRAIKQGAMQQLLKPKKGWVVKKLGDCLSKSPSYGINAAAVAYSDILPTYTKSNSISRIFGYGLRY